MAWWEILGWLGNACFFSRFLAQWWFAERNSSRAAPTLFWLLSIAGSLLMAVYAVERGVPVLVVGYGINGLIYLRNLRLKLGPRPTREPSMTFVTILALTAVAALAGAGVGQRISTIDGSLFWTVLAVAGQAIWSSRFAAQWWYSEKLGVSHFPPAFWWISLAGNAVLLSYAIHLRDPVFIVGLALGPIVQVRNLMIAKRTTTPTAEGVEPDVGRKLAPAQLQTP